MWSMSPVVFQQPLGEGEPRYCSMTLSNANFHCCLRNGNTLLVSSLCFLSISTQTHTKPPNHTTKTKQGDTGNWSERRTQSEPVQLCKRLSAVWKTWLFIECQNEDKDNSLRWYWGTTGPTICGHESLGTGPNTILWIVKCTTSKAHLHFGYVVYLQC